MTNPSTVWTQLSLPNPPAGALPFVDIDNASIVTDVLNLYYTALNSTLTGSEVPGQLTVQNGIRLSYTDNSGMPGSTTINKTAGRVAIAAGQTSITVTNSCCFSTSIIDINVETVDATLTRANVTPGTGSFTITGNAAATGNVKLSFIVNNVY